MKHFFLFLILLLAPAWILSTPLEKGEICYISPPASLVQGPLCGGKKCRVDTINNALKPHPLSVGVFTETKVPPKVSEGDTCKISHGNGNIKGICRHCGCHMKISKEDLEKECTYCKCAKLMKECLYHSR
jgi:hypothetical protein